MASSELFLLRRAHEPVAIGAHQQATVTGTASTLTTLSAPPISGAGGYLIQCNGSGAVARFTVNGTTPTASLGFRLTEEAPVSFTPADYAAAKFIIETGTPVLEIQAVR